jgi:uncharacterized protein YkwD
MRPRAIALTFAMAVAFPALGLADTSHEPPWTWAAYVASPRTVNEDTLPDRQLELQRTCGRIEAGLRDVAARVVARKLAGLTYLDSEALAEAQRVAGEPHVWARAWVVSGRALDHESTRAKLDAWGKSFREQGDRRCGVAVGFGADGTEVVAAVAVDALADLRPLPVETRVGTWLHLEANLLVPASGARVVVMGPTGRPRTVPTHLDGHTVRAELTLDRPGAFTVQVVLDLPTGPRPVLEGELFADQTPWTQPPDLAVPGEAAAREGATDHDALLAMIQSLRTTEALPVFASDARLDALALEHAEAMRRKHELAHDVGDGDPTARLEAQSLRASTSGENVAHAAGVVLAERALYASPSHRTNLLATSFDRVGVGVARDPDGSVWVTQEFAGGLR